MIERKKSKFLTVPLERENHPRKFPGLVSGPTIDWFLPWPEEALVAVSHGLVAEFPMDCPGDVKSLLMTHMGVVHRMVTEVGEENTWQRLPFLHAHAKLKLCHWAFRRRVCASLHLACP